MAVVRILHDLVGTRYEKGELVASELLNDVERLVGLGAVEELTKKEVPKDAEVVTAETEAVPGPEGAVSEEVAAAAVEAAKPEPEEKAAPKKA